MIGLLPDLKNGDADSRPDYRKEFGGYREKVDSQS
jgi:hypothetical protein